MSTGTFYIAVIMLLLAIIIILVLNGIKGRVPTKKLNEFESTIVKKSENLVSNHICSSDLRGIAFLESAAERDEQSETLFIDSIKHNEKIHITKYIWHYGVMLYNISEYKNKLARAKLEPQTRERIDEAIDEYIDCIIDILRYIYMQKSAVRCSDVIIQILDNFKYEENMIVSLNNSSAKVVKCSISLAKKISEEKYDEITKEEIVSGSMWFGRANFIEAYGFDRLCKAAEEHDLPILVAYSIVGDEIEMLVGTDDMRFFAYKIINYVTKGDDCQFSTRCDDFVKFVRKNAKSQIVRSSI